MRPKRGHTTPERARQITDLRSLARSYTKNGVRVLASIINDETQPGATRVSAIRLMFDRGWGAPNARHHIDINGETTLLKVVNEIVHVHETREQIEFNDQMPLLDLKPEGSDSGSKQTH